MSCRGPARQHGLVLVTSLLMLVLVTILAIGMFRSFGVDEKIAGNMREKQRALNAAETAEQFAESYLSSGAAITAAACTGFVTSTAGQVCTQTQQAQGLDPAALPWTKGVNYIPATMALPVSTGGGSGNYYANPVFYIGFLTTTTDVHTGVTTSYYQIDAAGFGGSANTAAVVEATYQISSVSTNLYANQ
jgi:type IV pilus assembly protein PilX